ncbi:MAG: GIY-YIG nuclease family protein [Proteobacteria bacterium]|nr:GIY-YIG nuclease family protein [Pseudomonadota bacterium]
MTSKPKTIEIFLPDGDPKSIKTASITSRIVEATYIPRSKVDLAKIRENLNSPAVYILATSSQDHSKPEVYIGETENFIQRLNTHNARMDFWDYAISFTSKTGFFTKTHVKYLEWLFYQNAAKANRCKLHNSEQSKPRKPHLSESVEADLIDNFETISILVSVLGLNLFQEVAQEKKDDLVFECKNNKGQFGQGKYNEEGFVIFKGAKCAIELSKTFQESSPPSIRNTLIQDKILLRKGEHYELQEDFIFSSPSTAAQIVLGSPANGWNSWKLKDGKTLDEIYRKNN